MPRHCDCVGTAITLEQRRCDPPPRTDPHTVVADAGCQSFSFANVEAAYSSSYGSSSGGGLQKECVISTTQLYYDYQWKTFSKVAGGVTRLRARFLSTL